MNNILSVRNPGVASPDPLAQSITHTTRHCGHPGLQSSQGLPEGGPASGGILRYSHLGFSRGQLTAVAVCFISSKGEKPEKDCGQDRRHSLL